MRQRTATKLDWTEREGCTRAFKTEDSRHLCGQETLAILRNFLDSVNLVDHTATRTGIGRQWNDLSGAFVYNRLG